MKHYRCHKLVEAAKIEAIDGAVLRLSDQDVLEVSPAWLRRHLPVVGGYVVRYEDGYTSFSPAKAFEDGYTLIEP